jgi:hypothetical protein
MHNSSENGIVLTPDFAHMFQVMLREAVTQSGAVTLFDCLGTVERTALALRAVQRFLAPLNIAAQCMTNREAVEQFREALNQIVQDIGRVAGQREEFLAVDWENKT